MAGEILCYTLAGRFIDERDLPAVLDRVFPHSTSRYHPPTPEDDRICMMLVESGCLFRDEIMGGYGRK